MSLEALHLQGFFISGAAGLHLRTAALCSGVITQCLSIRNGNSYT
ncbi:hypothetical protein ALO75_102173 [Pseudomonas syringae pv. coryli]|uniref:Uncharacterized protein n=1 Tax=Pseudomonas syringae pv. coryli TaxID=317659 RepID=A0A0P9NAR1_9PSED|nr:hypothetical protein ALO75_102173 [Pseudomonas syringae pv. coryli]